VGVPDGSAGRVHIGTEVEALRYIKTKPLKMNAKTTADSNPVHSIRCVDSTS